MNFLRCYYIKSIISSSITMTLCLDFDVLHGIASYSVLILLAPIGTNYYGAILNSHDDDTWKTVLAGDLGIR